MSPAPAHGPFDPTAPGYDPSEGDYEARIYGPGRRRASEKSVITTELVAAVASATGQRQTDVKAIIDALFSTISNAVANGASVSIPGWITISQVATPARTGRNPQTGEEIRIPAGKRVKLTPGSRLKSATHPM